jgi:RNA polymerase sigma-70 factor, ECF subfamily
MTESSPTTGTIADALDGDADAWRALVESTGGFLLGLARRMIRDSVEAEDVVQGIYMRIQRHLGRYDPSRPFKPWLRRLAVNHVLNHMRSRRKMVSLEARAQATGEEPVDSRIPAPPANALAGEKRDAVRAAIAGLPEDYRVIVTLRYLGERSVREVADLLDLPEGTAKIRLYRARALLKDVLEDWL